MSSHRSPGRTRRSEDVQRRVVGPRRVGPEQAGDRRVEVGAVGDLAKPVDLLGVRPDARGPGRLQQRDEVRARVDVRVAARDVDGDLADQLRMRRDHRPEAAVAGRLGDEPERRAADAAPGCARRHPGRPARRWAAPRPAARRAGHGSPRPDTIGWSPSTMSAPSTSPSSASIPIRTELDNAPTGIRVPDAALAPPVDRPARPRRRRRRARRQRPPSRPRPIDPDVL